MSPGLNIISSWIIRYGYFVILPVSIIEGPIITVISAFLARQGYFNVWLVLLIVVLGDLIGDLLYYSFGYYGKNLSGTAFGHLVGISEERIKKIAEHFENHSGKTIFWGKLTHSMGWAVLPAAGAAKMPLGRFLGFNLIATIPKSLAFVLVGYYIGYAYQSIDSYINKIALITFFVLAILIFWYFKRKKDAEKITL
jgi:membrane protein DedA with SNARE-associated domain